MPVPIQKTNYVAEGQGRLISRYRYQPTMLALVAVYLAEIQTLENVLWDVILKRFLSTAANTNPLGTMSDVLQQLGKLVGQDRSGLNNALFGAVISLRIRANRSNGRAEDIIQIAAILKAVSARYQLTITGATASNGGQLVTVPSNANLYVGDTVELSNQPGVQYTIQALPNPTTVVLSTLFTGASASGLTLTLDTFGLPPTGTYYEPTGQVTYLELYPAGYLVEIWQLLSQLVGLNLLPVARPPGVYAVLHYTTWKQISVMGSRSGALPTPSVAMVWGSRQGGVTTPALYSAAVVV